MVTIQRQPSFYSYWHENAVFRIIVPVLLAVTATPCPAKTVDPATSTLQVPPAAGIIHEPIVVPGVTAFDEVEKEIFTRFTVNGKVVVPAA